METNKIHHGDCTEVLKDFGQNSIDLVITSPPYNVGKEYSNYSDDISMSEYRSLIARLFHRLDAVVKNDGRVCVNVSLKNDNEIIDIPSLIKEEANKFNWNLRFEIIWHKGSSESSTAWGSWRSPSSPRPIFNHEYIFVFDIGEESKNSEKTISKERFMQLVKSVWDVKPQTTSEHPAPFPVKIPKRLIELNSYEDDMILDPFMGSGTTALAAEKMNRKWTGIEMSKEYIQLAYHRLERETGKTFTDRGIFDY